MNGRSSHTPSSEPFAIRLIDAVERIVTTESPSTVSMRAIAAEADCSLGVAYNHFDSKMELIGAALDRMAQRITSDAIGVGDGGDALEALLDAVHANAAFPRLLTWMVLEGQDVSAVMTAHPLAQSVSQAAADRGAKDPASVALTMGLLALGMYTYGPMLNLTVGRDPNDERLLEAVAEMFAGWFPPAAL